MSAAIYSIDTGIIDFRYYGDAEQAMAQAGPGQAVYLDCPENATHIKDGEPVFVAYVMPRDMAVAAIRAERNRRITDTDWTQLPDTPLDAGKRAQWALYRQQLRDFPEMCDPYNPVWPVSP